MTDSLLLEVKFNIFLTLPIQIKCTVSYQNLLIFSFFYSFEVLFHFKEVRNSENYYIKCLLQNNIQRKPTLKLYTISNNKT